MSFNGLRCCKVRYRTDKGALLGLGLGQLAWGTNMLPQSQPVPAGFSTPTSKNGHRRILSVDDEPGILFTREKLLQNAGYEVLSAADGEQALHFFTTHAVDLVLLDYLLPGMDGAVIARAMKQEKPLVPVIIVSASPVEDQTPTCVDCFIQKGEGPALLLEKIRQLLAPLSTAQL